MSGTIETYTANGQWMNRKEGSEEQPFGHSESSLEAAEFGRAAAIRDGAMHIIRDIKGAIHRSTSYANPTE